MNIIFTTITTDQEIQQLLDLQQKNLTKNIAEDVANSQGFVTVVHNFDLLSRMNQSVSQIIAKDGDEVVGYALVMPESFTFIFQTVHQFKHSRQNWNIKPKTFGHH